MSFTDKLKQKAQELDLQTKAEQLSKAATEAAHQAKEKAGDLAHSKRHQISSAIDQAGEAVDKKTDGKYADKVAKAKAQANKGVDKLAEQRAPHQPGETLRPADPGVVDADPIVDHNAGLNTGRHHPQTPSDL